MTPELTPEAWAQIRADYEHTERPVEDICAEHGISSGTLRDRMRRWGWTRRRPPIPLDGPPPAPALPLDMVTPALSPAPAFDAAAPSPAAPPIEPAAPPEPDGTTIVPRLQSAVARVLPAIESIVARVGAQPMQPREMERAARALAALTRTLRELNSLLGQRQAAAAAAVAADDDVPEDMDAFRFELARRIDAFVASRTGANGGEAEPQP